MSPLSRPWFQWRRAAKHNKNTTPGSQNTRTRLLVEQLEERLAPAVQVLSVADPSYYGGDPNHTADVTIFQPYAAKEIVVSGNGRYVAYTSNATNLLPAGITVNAGTITDVYVRDLQTGATIPVSINSAGTAMLGVSAGSLNSLSISADGRYVAFTSDANAASFNPALTDGNGTLDVFVRDLQLGTTTLVSRSTTGPNTGNDGSTFLGMTSDGRNVVFESRATDLTAGFVDGNGASNYDLFVRDLQAGTTTLVSLNAAGNAGGNGSSSKAVITPNGRFVAFYSNASDLVGGGLDANATRDAYYRDLQTGQTFLVSVNGAGNNGGNGITGNSGRNLDISDDGRYVMFESQANDISPDNPGSGLVTDIFVRDMQALYTEAISVRNQGGMLNGNQVGSSNATMSADGRYVAFENASGFIVPGYVNHNDNGDNEVYVRDRTLDATTLVTRNTSGPADGPNDLSRLSGMSADGRYLAIYSRATDLMAGFVDGNGSDLSVGGSSNGDLFLYDLQAGTTTLVTPNAAGTASGNNESTGGVFSGDGNSLVFISRASDLSNASDINDAYDAFQYTVNGSSISGRVFNDLNGDGNADASEDGLAGWTVFLDDGDGTLEVGEASRLTDALGNYSFTGLVVGTFTVALELQPNYAQTAPTPVPPGTWTVPVSALGQLIDGKDFGVVAPPPNLMVQAFGIPGTLIAGQPLAVSYTVENAGLGAALGSWYDAIYLSTDATLDAGDKLLKSLPHFGGLAAGNTYLVNTSVNLGGVQGQFYLLAAADRFHQVAEGDEVNNLTPSTNKVDVGVSVLALGVGATNTFTGIEQEHYYQVTVPAGQNLLFTVDSTAATGTLELYVRRGAPPTVTSFDFKSTSGAPDQFVGISDTPAVTWYVTVRSRLGQAAASSYTVTAAFQNLAVLDISPNQAVNAGLATVQIAGAGFSAATQVRLIDGATTLVASVDVRSSSLLFATFDLAGQDVGFYDVRVQDGGDVVTRADAFQIQSGAALPVSVSLSVPEFMRSGREDFLVLTYENTSGIDVEAPILQVSSTGALIRFLDEKQYRGNSVQLLATADDGPAGILKPGERVALTLAFTPTTLGDVEFIVEQADRAQTIDWNALKAGLRPEDIPAAAWDVIYANLVAQAGTTVADYQTMLASDATYLSQFGTYTTDLARLYNFALQKASMYLAGSTLAGATDAAFAAPGLSLGISRVFNQGITDRYQMGTFGLGWTHSWDIRAAVDAAGNVTIHAGGGQRFFQLQSNGSFTGGVGDLAKLTRAGSIYTLVEEDGTIVKFRADGFIDFVEDLNGNRITAGYTSGRLASLTHSNGSAITIEYNGAGLISKITDPVGRATDFTYDAANLHLLTATDQFGTTTYTYLSGTTAALEHSLSAIEFSDGTHIFYDYDPQGRLLGSRRDGNQEALTFAYDGQTAVTVTNAVGDFATTVYDDKGRQVEVADALGRSTIYVWCDCGNLRSIIGPQGTTVTLDYDARGNISSIVDALGQQTTFSYNQRNELISYTDARGNTTTYQRDSKGNLLSIVYPNGKRQDYSYNPLGQPMQFVNARGNAIDFTYDNAGRLTRKDFADGSYQTFTYDPRGNLTAARTFDAADALTYEITMAYDAVTDLLLRIDYVTDGRFLEFTYDPTSQRRTQSVDQDGFTIQYLYDSLGRLSELRDLTGGGAGTLVVHYTYDLAGRLVQKDNGNGTYTTYAYDQAGQLLHLINYAPDDSINSRFDYTYDLLGRRIATSMLEGDWTYEYDTTGQLTHAVFVSNNTAVLPDQDLQYFYDAVGNRVKTLLNGVETLYVANEVNEYTQIGADPLTYDADGNLLTRTTGGVTTTYTWDDESRLLGVSDGTDTYTYTIDPFGQRKSMTRNGVTTEYLIDPTGLGNIVGEYDVLGTTVAAYTHGLGLTSRVTSTGAAWYDFDAIGSAVGSTGVDGSLANGFAYLPFGESLAISGVISSPFAFVGQFGVLGDGSGLLHMRARDYSSNTGQFLSLDPLGLAGADANMRRYANNAPTNAIDPRGTDWVYIPKNTDGYPIKVIIDIPEVAITTGTVFDAIPTLPAPSIGIPGIAGKIADKVAPSPFKGIDFEGRDRTFRLPRIDGRGQVHEDGLPLRFKVPVVQIPIPKVKLPDLSDLVRKLGKDLIKVLSACDPNYVTGPAGFGAANFIDPTGQTFGYRIQFQNDPNLATAPAQEVIITHQLDADLDWSTFQLGSFGFGSLVVNVPEGRQNYQTRVKYQNQDGSDLLVDFSAEVNLETGVATFTLRSVDPETGALPAGVFDGFLPVEDGSGRGDGFVTYTIQPKAGLASGTTIDQQASIVFDTNDPIATNTFTNTVDVGTPTSSVNALPAVTNTTSFLVTWSGNDGSGSGIAAYDVYVRDNTGAFTLWKDDTTQTSATYAGTFGHTYSFYSIATDNVGLTQATPGGAQATTSLVAQPPTLDLNGPAAGVNFAATFSQGGGSILIVDPNLTVTDASVPTLISATVTLVGIGNGTLESLSASTAGTVIVASYNPGTGVLSLTGNDTLAHYQQVLLSVRYNNTSVNPVTQPGRTVGFVVNDGQNSSTPVSTTVQLLAQANVAVFRPGSGQWFIDQVQASYDPATTNQIDNFGTVGDVAVRGDWVGDGRMRVGVFRPSTGQWFLSLTDTNYTPTNTLQIDNFGQAGDIAVVGKWQGGSIDRIGIFRPSTGQWFLSTTNTSYTSANTLQIDNFGTVGDQAAVGDWDGTGVTKVGAFRAGTSQWFLSLTNTNYTPANTLQIDNFGAVGDQAAVGDWDRTGFTKIGVFRAGSSQWFLSTTNTNYTAANTLQIDNFGTVGDQAAVGDWLADGTTRIGVFRAGSSQWFLSTTNTNYTAANTLQIDNFGTVGDQAVAGTWQYGLPQLLAGPEVSGSGASGLTADALPAIIAAALQRWRTIGLSDRQVARLAGLHFGIVDLPVGWLGEYVGGTEILLDVNAGGHGWFIDDTPDADEEFDLNGQAAIGGAVNRVDLLTVVMHEMGHALGSGPTDANRAIARVMAEALAPGQRRSLADTAAAFMRWN
ncbi:MAG: pre-peptidase C-terminal domain-containing protein [Gemmataceae bacterium]|nr:pre-peptidase C-terminal domain-containing protein [Gemmataceae bacterium]